MRYLKTYEGLFDFLKKKKIDPPIATPLKINIKSILDDAEDICQELKDEGFHIEIGATPYMYHYTGDGIAMVYKAKGITKFGRVPDRYIIELQIRRKNHNIFTYSDISEAIERLRDYMTPYEFKISEDSISILSPGMDYEYKKITFKINDITPDEPAERFSIKFINF